MSRLAAIVTPAPGARGGGVEHHSGLVAGVLADKGWRVEEVGDTSEISPWARRAMLTARIRARRAVAPLRDLDPDLVISNGTLGAGAPKVPRIHVYHGTMVAHTRLGGGDTVRREYYRRLLTNAREEWAAGRGATTVAVSEQVAGEVRRYYRHTVDAVIPLCADLEHFRPRSKAQARKRFGLGKNEKLALYVGRMEYRKGADMLAEICEIAGCGLIVAGDGAPEGAVHLGQLTHEELPWAYAAADVVLFPTRYEGFGFVSLEALACERPLVTTRTGWATTLAQEVPGYSRFVVASEVQPLAHALRVALQHPDEVPVAEAARLVHETASLERFRERWSELIDAVAG